MKKAVFLKLVGWVNHLIDVNVEMRPHGGKYINEDGLTDPKYWTYEETMFFFELKNQNEGFCKLREWLLATANGIRRPYYNSKFYF
jgi:hypothetical protein